MVEKFRVVIVGNIVNCRFDTNLTKQNVKNSRSVIFKDNTKKTAFLEY